MASGKVTKKIGGKSKETLYLPSPKVFYNVQSGSPTYKIPTDILIICPKNHKLILALDSVAFQSMQPTIAQLTKEEDHNIDMILVINSSPLPHAETMCALKKLPYTMLGYSLQQPLNTAKVNLAPAAAYFNNSKTVSAPKNNRRKGNVSKETAVKFLELPTLF